MEERLQKPNVTQKFYLNTPYMYNDDPSSRRRHLMRITHWKIRNLVQASGQATESRVSTSQLYTSHSTVARSQEQ